MGAGGAHRRGGGGNGCGGGDRAARKEKKWTCADCGKAHKERSAVKGKGGGYVWIGSRAACGLMEGRRAHKRQRPLEAGS